MKKKRHEVVLAPMVACPDCGGMRCTLLTAIREHPDGTDGNLIITTLIGIVAELLSAPPPDHDAESARVVHAMFVDLLADMRAMPAREGERLH